MDRVCTVDEQLYTMQQIADLAGVSRTTVFRYIDKNGIRPYKQELNRKQYNEQQKDEIVAAISPAAGEEKDQEFTQQEMEIFDLMKNQLAAKDEQIAQLQKLVDQQQQLQIKTQIELKNTQDQLAIETEKSKKGFWARLFGR